MQLKRLVLSTFVGWVNLPPHTLLPQRLSQQTMKKYFSGTVYMFIYLKNGILQIYAVFPPQSVCISV